MKKGSRGKKRKRFFPWIISAILLIILATGVGYLFFIPDISKLVSENPQKTAFMAYREREWKAKGKRVKIKQRWVPLSQISPHLIRAVIIAEDDKFWKHNGFDYEAIRAAIEQDIAARRFKFGGSTISQQLAKNLYLSPAKNPLRKIREAIITWRLERTLSKRRILELYLNVIEWGEGIFGAEAAARYYYGKSASRLTPLEAARLAAVIPNPRRLNPRDNHRSVVRRSNRIWHRIMAIRGREG